MSAKITKEYLLDKGWLDKSGVCVLFTSPRIGWKENGTLIVGWHEWPSPVTKVTELKSILNTMGVSIYAKQNKLTN